MNNANLVPTLNGVLPNALVVRGGSVGLVSNGGVIPTAP
uniref:Uncharacterized protein n=1 Tax=Levilactobacillus brevis TaxID=1580 RepID=D7PVF9_LEVBR|nr:hypothetical protein [Levilactobacillus brevis]